MKKIIDFFEVPLQPLSSSILNQALKRIHIHTSKCKFWDI